MLEYDLTDLRTFGYRLPILKKNPGLNRYVNIFSFLLKFIVKKLPKYKKKITFCRKIYLLNVSLFYTSLCTFPYSQVGSRVRDMINMNKNFLITYMYTSLYSSLFYTNLKA